MAARYLEQYERMKRSYVKFEALNREREHATPSVHYEDDIYAFFMNCWQLKDWIKNDSKDRATILRRSKELDQFINANEHLKLCQDLCNSLKHLRNDNRSGEAPTFGPKRYDLDISVRSSIPPNIKLKWLVDRDTQGPIDAFELACKCVRAWESFLTSTGLL